MPSCLLVTTRLIIQISNPYNSLSLISYLNYIVWKHMRNVIHVKLNDTQQNEKCLFTYILSAGVFYSVIIQICKIIHFIYFVIISGHILSFKV